MNPDISASNKPLAKWHSILNKDICTLNQFMLLRTRREDEHIRKQMAPWFQAVSESVTDIEQIAQQLKHYVVEEETKLFQLERLEKSISIQTERFALMKAQMPAEVVDCLDMNAKTEPGKEDARKENDQPQVNRTTEPMEPKAEPAPVKASSNPKMTRKHSKAGSRKNAGATAPPQGRAPPSDADVPVINSVSQEELDAAPQYVKGRLTLEKIQGVVTCLNTIVASKYNLLNRPYRDLNSNEITQWQDFRENECDETAGKSFVTDTEIKGFGKLRLDATAKSVINVLRHVGALKEVRGKNRSRIFIIN